MQRQFALLSFCSAQPVIKNNRRFRAFTSKENRKIIVFLHKMTRYTLYIIAFVLLCSCRRENTYRAEEGDTLHLKHAALLTIIRQDSFTTVEVLDAWKKGKILHRYLLIPKTSPLPHKLPHGTVVRTPLTRSVVFSSVHGSLLCTLGRTDAIVAMCDSAYIFHPELRRRLQAGQIKNAGSSMQPDVEQIVKTHSEALLVSPFENTAYGPIERLGVPLIECADYMETSALGRAEWMRFFGMLYGCEATADSLFNVIEHNYEQWAKKVASVRTHRPSLLTDMRTGGVWYVPGGNSTLGRLYHDAGIAYRFARLPESGSVSLSFETVFTQAHDADLWFIKYGNANDLTYTKLADDDNRYRQFLSWKKRRIFGCNTFRVPYYEEAPFRPDLLLRDFLLIAHPSLLPDEQPRYFTPLADTP